MSEKYIVRIPVPIVRENTVGYYGQIIPHTVSHEGLELCMDPDPDSIKFDFDAVARVATKMALSSVRDEYLERPYVFVQSRADLEDYCDDEKQLWLDLTLDDRKYRAGLKPFHAVERVIVTASLPSESLGKREDKKFPHLWRDYTVEMRDIDCVEILESSKYPHADNKFATQLNSFANTQSKKLRHNNPKYKHGLSEAHKCELQKLIAALEAEKDNFFSLFLRTASLKRVKLDALNRLKGFNDSPVALLGLIEDIKKNPDVCRGITSRVAWFLLRIKTEAESDVLAVEKAAAAAVDAAATAADATAAANATAVGAGAGAGAGANAYGGFECSDGRFIPFSGPIRRI